MPTARCFLCVILIAALLSGCAGPQVTVAPERPAVKTVAVLPFDNRSGAREPVGETAADHFAREILRLGRYQVIAERSAERSVRIESTVGENGGAAGEKVEVVATETTADPVERARKLGADAVLVGAVTKYRHRQAFIFPPAEVSIEARLVHVATRQVLWSASDTRRYGTWRWLTFLAWPVGVLLAFFSPPADARLRQACAKTGAAVEQALAQSAH